MSHPRKQRLIAGVIAGAAAVALVSATAPSFADSTPSSTPVTKPVTRLAGSDRIGTAIAISQNLYPTGSTANAVILTAEYDFPDAMSAGPLAKSLNAPILLTDPGTLTPATLTEIERVLPSTLTPVTPSTTSTTVAPTSTTAAPSTQATVTHGCAVPEPVETPTNTTPTVISVPTGPTVYIIGGAAAIAPGIDTTLNNDGYNVVRISGPNRFATSVAVAKCEGSPTNLFLATGLIFADALSAGPAAATMNGAVLLTNGDTLPPEVSTYISSVSNPVVYTVGAAATEAYPSVATGNSFVGGDRYATSALVAEHFFTDPTVVGVATGADFPDALAGGGAMGLKGGPVLLSDPNQLPSAEALYLTNEQSDIQQAFLFGGTDALSPAIATTVSNQINGNP